MKYFFLSEGWHVGRVWEFGGLWNEASWRRRPEIRQLNLCISENGERLWLYAAEDAVLMLEVRPGDPSVTTPNNRTIGQVVLKRLMTPDQAIALLASAEAIYRTFDQASQIPSDATTQPVSIEPSEKQER